MKLFRQLLDFLLYSNIFVSVCAAALTVETYLIIQPLPEYINWQYVGFVFCSTLALYNFPTVIGVDFSSGNSERHVWISGNKKLLVAIFSISALASGGLVWFFPIRFILWFLPAGVIAVAYFFPQTHLRNVLGLKAGIVALIWTCVTCVYPMLLQRLPFSDLSNFFYGYSVLRIAQRFFFMLPLCIIFNVRDMEADRKDGVRTLPLAYGIPVTKIICLISLFLFTGFIPYPFGYRSMLLVLSAIVTGVFILGAKRSGSDYYYTLWVDGMMLLQPALVIGYTL